MTPTRLGVLVIGMAACLWFGLAIRSLDDRARVLVFLHRHPVLSQSQAKALDATVAEARFLNPDQSLNNLRALVASEAQDLPRAVAIARSIARAEPANFANWVTLQFFVGSSDPATYRLAQARIQALLPPVQVSP